MIKEIVFTIMILSIFLPTALAQTNTSTVCIDGHILSTNISHTKFVNDTLIETGTHEFLEYCQYGCDDDQCNPHPFMQYLWVILLLIAIFGGGYIISKLI